MPTNEERLMAATVELFGEWAIGILDNEGFALSLNRLFDVAKDIAPDKMEAGFREGIKRVAAVRRRK
jgi:hypothetical protein